MNSIAKSMVALGAVPLACLAGCSSKISSAVYLTPHGVATVEFDSTYPGTCDLRNRGPGSVQIELTGHDPGRSGAFTLGAPGVIQLDGAETRILRLRNLGGEETVIDLQVDGSSGMRMQLDGPPK